MGRRPTLEDKLLAMGIGVDDALNQYKRDEDRDVEIDRRERWEEKCRRYIHGRLTLGDVREVLGALLTDRWWPDWKADDRSWQGETPSSDD